MIILRKSIRKDKKYMVVIDNKMIHFGAAGYEDYTNHKDLKRKNAYIVRHKKKEDWSASGIKTAGFWARWLLWNRKSISGSIKDIERLFSVKIKNEI